MSSSGAIVALSVYLVCLALGGAWIALAILDVGPAAAASARGAGFGLAFFGLTGALFTLLQVGPALALALALGWAAVAAASIRRLIPGGAADRAVSDAPGPGAGHQRPGVDHRAPKPEPPFCWTFRNARLVADLQSQNPRGRAIRPRSTRSQR